MGKLNLKGSSAIITGAGSGLNLAFAKQLHAKGCNIFIADIGLHPDGQAFLDSVQAQKESSLPKVAFHKTDVADWTQLEAVFDEFERTWGGAPDIVCPGAGIYDPNHTNFWADNDPASHYKVLDINLLHPIKTTRIAIKRMLAHGKSGIIIHISSIGDQFASIVTPLYLASKAAISSFVRSMGPLYDLAGIRVVAVAPGTMGTPFFYSSELTKSFVNQEKDFMLEPGDVAKGMVALVEDGKKYPSGTVLEVADIGEETWRMKSILNDPGVQGRACKVSNKENAIEVVKQWLRSDREGKQGGQVNGGK